MVWDYFNIFLLLAAAQGFFLTALIFHKHGDLFANRFLGGMLLFYSIILLNLFLGETGFLYHYPLLIIVQFGLPFLIGPLHYLYARYLTHSYSRLLKYDWLHLIPFGGFEIYFMIRMGTDRETILTTLRNIESEGLLIDSQIFNWIILLQGLIYMLLTLVLLKRYSRRIKAIFSSVEQIQLHWLRNITYLTLLVVISFLIENILLLAGINFSNYFSFTSLLAAVAVYAMGYLGLLKSEIFKHPEIARSISQTTAMEKLPPRNDKWTSAGKYEKSGLNPEKARQYLDQIRMLMETEKPYTENQLTLTQLAEKLGMTPHNLSEVINGQLNQNFFDFVNHYRVERVKKDLSDPAKKHLKILSIAYDAGFNSKATFNTIFKNHTGMTPSQYRRQTLSRSGRV